MVIMKRRKLSGLRIAVMMSYLSRDTVGIAEIVTLLLNKEELKRQIMERKLINYSFPTLLNRPTRKCSSHMLYLTLTALSRLS